MAYTKQTWTDDVSAVTGARMTHIEDGIYDNSTDVTAVKSALNLSGTATTTQTDFTEGQLTQKLGLKYIKMKGQTSQYTTTGKNLLGLIDGTYTQGTITATVKNGTITLNGTASSNTFLDISTENYDLVVGTAYTITINNPVATTNSGDLRFRTESSGSYDVYLGNTNASRTITLASNDDLGNKITIRIASGVALTNFILKPQIEKNSTATSYEPYTNGASPNPSYPQDVNNVTGSNVIKVCNKNLLRMKKNQTTVNGTTITIKESSIKLNGTASSATSYNEYPMDYYLEAGTYTIKTHTSGTSGTTQAFVLYNGSTALVNISYNQNNNSQTFTLTEKTQITRIAFWITSGTVNTNFEAKIQLEIGSTATSFTTHREEDYYIDLPVENKLPYPYVQTTRTAEGITYTDLGDGRIKINGTATANSAFKLLGEASSQVAIPGNYVYGGVNSNVRVRAMNKSSGGTYTTLGSSTGSSTLINRGTYETGYVEISIASGTTVNNLIITPMLSDNEVNAYTPYNENPIELCKIGNYQDYIYKNNGKWYKYGAIGKVTLDGTETWSYSSGNLVFYTDVINTLAKSNTSLYCTHYKPVDNSTTYANMNSGEIKAQHDNSLNARLIIKNTAITSANDFKTWLASNNTLVYYQLVTPIEEEITYEPLITQLDKLDKIGLYDISNISQDNSDMKMLLDFIICNDNYNGLREFIRA